MKINQLVFIKNLMIDKRLTKCNTNAMSMKIRSAIKLLELKNYEQTNLYKYQ